MGCIYCAGCTDACQYAGVLLKNQGFRFADRPCAEVTDLLLDVPSFQPGGLLRSGEKPAVLLSALRPEVRVFGGKLQALEGNQIRVDLLEDARYLASNAAITADCALRLAGPHLKTTWQGCRVLVIGWGRIGKCLCRMLRALGAVVTVCARKAPDCALLQAFGYETLEPSDLDGRGFDLIFNTVPALMMEKEALGDCPLAIDLASREGLKGPQVLWARGLPGSFAPIRSGELIAATVRTYLKR